MSPPEQHGEKAPRRQLGYDVARALAVFGMVVVNFKIVMGAEAAGPSWLAWLVGCLDGRAAATFVVLAGVGISLLTKRARAEGDADALAAKRRSLYKRAAVLFCFGLLYSPLWPADILHFYGVYLLIGAGLLNASDRRLWRLAILLALAFLPLLLLLDYERGWEWTTLTYTDFWTAGGMLRHLFFNGFHPVIPWAAFLLVGMWLGRQPLVTPVVRRRILVGGLLATLVAEIASVVLTGWMLASFPGENPTDIRDLCGTAPMPPTPLYLLSAGGTALALITACHAICQRFATATWLLRPLTATGQLALTLYVAHVVVGMGMLEALGRLEHQSLSMAVVSALLFSAGGMGFAVVWRRHARQGPLEWLLRKMTA